MHDLEWIFKKENMQQKVNVELGHQIFLPTLFTSFKNNRQTGIVFRGIYFLLARKQLFTAFEVSKQFIMITIHNIAISTLSISHGIMYPEIQVSPFSSKITVIQICCCRVQMSQP